jgi:superfamily II DNA or RNA helicase
MEDLVQNQNRSKIQSNAVKLSNIHQHLVLEWSTGCGKTLAAVKIVESIMMKNPDAKGYLVCKESTHKQNWYDDIKKHRKLKILNNITTLLYASLHKHKKKADFIILDECHALTPARVKKMMPMLSRDTKLIFLSATIPQERKDAIRRLCTKVHFDSIPLKKAIELKLLPEPVLIVHRIGLKKSIEGKIWDFVYRKPKGKMRRYCTHKELYTTLKKYPKEMGIVVQGSEQEYYDAITKQMAYYKDLSESLTVPYPVRNGCRNKFLNLGSVRKNFIAEVKTERVKELVKEFRKEDVRFICFTGSIKQAKEIGSSSAVHSKNEKGKNQNLIDCFNDGTCKELFAVKMLRESVNLTNIERGIITQLDSSIGSFYQMLGRCLRHEFPEMNIIVLDGTQDVSYFKKSMDSFDKKYIRVV